MTKRLIFTVSEGFGVRLHSTKASKKDGHTTYFCWSLCSIFISTFIFGLPLAVAEEKFILQPVLESVVKVWDKAPHNAFTSLIRFKGSFYLTFREAEQHAVPNVGRPGGNIRILKSHDGQLWNSVTVINGGINKDLRDARLSITPAGDMMLNTAFSPHDSPSAIQSQVWISNDGISWDGPVDIGDKNWWLWKVVWGSDNFAYSIAYRSLNNRLFDTRLYRSKNGYHYEILIPSFSVDNNANEAALVINKNGQAIALIRREKQKNGLVCVSENDYKNWRFFDFGVRVEGPELIELPSGIIIAAVRVPGGAAHTALFSLDTNTGQATHVLRLPSGGDNGYPGLVWHKETLWMSYYSSHEGKASIYLAKIKFVKKRITPNNQKDSKPAIQDNRVSNLRKEISELQKNRATLSIKYTDMHPDMMALERQIREIEKRINVLIGEAEGGTQ